MLAALGVTQVAAGQRAPVARVQLPEVVIENVSSQTPSVSADGQLVVYAGAPTAEGDSRSSTVWLKDRLDGSVVELTKQSSDVRPGDSVWPVLSADGCTVTTITELAFDLFRDDDRGARWDVYRQLLPRCGGVLDQWELVSASQGSGFEATAGDDVSPLYPPAVSGEGSEVAYTHAFSVASPDLLGIMLVDLSVAIGEPGRSNPVAGSPTEAPNSTFLHTGLREPAISADGSVLAFTSDANSSSPLAEWGSGAEAGRHATTNVYVWDRSNPDPASSVRQLSNSLADVPADAPAGDPGNSFSPTVSGNGQFVAFVSTAAQLVPDATMPACNPACAPQVYLFARTDGSLRLASRQAGDPTTAAVAADTGGRQPVLNHNGDELLYVSRATNLFPTRSNAAGDHTDGDIVLFVPSTGVVQRVSVLADGISPAPAANSHPQLSSSGRVVVFDTLAGAAYDNPAFNGRQVAIIDRPALLQLANLDVGTVAVGFPGPEWWLEVTNHGPASFLPATVEVSNTDFLISGGSCIDELGVSVPPGGQCTVRLMLMPSVAGAITGTLTVSEAGPDPVSVTADVSGNGGDPALAPLPAGGFGGEVVVGAIGAPVLFALNNVAFNPVRIGQLVLEGSHPGDFRVALDECSGKTIDAGQSCNLQVVFSPTAAGRRTANVVAGTGAGAYATILVSGDGRYDPKLAVSKPTIIAGSRALVMGTGFAPDAQVTVSWADGNGWPLAVTADPTGSFQVTLVVRPTDRPGARSLVAQTIDGQVVAADVLVVGPAHRAAPGVSTWAGN